MGQGYLHKVLELLVIAVLLSSLQGCFGGINPNDVKSSTTTSPSAVTGSVTLPANMVVNASASALRVSSSGLQAAATQGKPSSVFDTSTIAAPDGTKVEFINSQLQVVDTATTRGGKYAVDLDVENYVDHADPDFLTAYVRVTYGDGVQMQVISEPITEAGAEKVGGELASVSALTANVSPDTTGVALSVLKYINADLVNPSNGKEGVQLSPSQSISLTGADLYHSIHLFESLFANLGELFPRFISFMTDGDDGDGEGFYGGNVIFQSILFNVASPFSRAPIEEYDLDTKYSNAEIEAGLSNLWDGVTKYIRSQFSQGDDQNDNENNNNGEGEGNDDSPFDMGFEAFLFSNTKVEMMLLSTCYYVSLALPPDNIPQWEVLKFFYTGISSYRWQITSHCSKIISDFYGIEEIDQMDPDSQTILVALALQNNLRTLSLIQEMIPRVLAKTEAVKFGESKSKLLWETVFNSYDVPCLEIGSCDKLVAAVSQVYDEWVGPGIITSNNAAHIISSLYTLVIGLPKHLVMLVFDDSFGEDNENDDADYDGWNEDDKKKDMAAEEFIVKEFGHNRTDRKIAPDRGTDHIPRFDKKMGVFDLVLPLFIEFYSDNKDSIVDIITSTLNVDDVNSQLSEDVQEFNKKLDYFDNPIMNLPLTIMGLYTSTETVFAIEAGFYDNELKEGQNKVDVKSKVKKIVELKLKGLLDGMTDCGDNENLKNKHGDICGAMDDAPGCDPNDPHTCDQFPEGSQCLLTATTEKYSCLLFCDSDFECGKAFYGGEFFCQYQEDDDESWCEPDSKNGKSGSPTKCDPQAEAPCEGDASCLSIDQFQEQLNSYICTATCEKEADCNEGNDGGNYCNSTSYTQDDDPISICVSW